MIRIHILLMFLPFMGIAQEGKFTVKGQLNGLPNNIEVVLKNEEVGPIASTKSSNGRFELTGTITEPGLYQLEVNQPGTQKLSLFLDASTLLVEGDFKAISTAKVSGSAIQDDFNQFNATFNPLFSKLTTIAQQLNQGVSDPNGSIRKGYNEVIAEVNAKTDAFIDQHQQSPVSPFLLLVTMQLNDDPAIMDKRLARISAPALNNYFGRMAQKMVEDAKFGAVGTEAPDFTQQDTNGNDVKLSSFRGKYVLVDFWASWCGPCRQENPNVVNAFKKYKDRNFTVLGVSLDRAKDPWLKAIKDDQLQWTQLSDLKFWNNAVAVQYKIQSIPQNFLIDPKGVIVGKNLRGEELQSRLAILLK